MEEATRIVLDVFKKQNIQANVVTSLHTFDSKFEFNSHGHIVVTMGGVTKDNHWEIYGDLNYKMLRVYWQNAVLKLIWNTLSSLEIFSDGFLID